MRGQIRRRVLKRVATGGVALTAGQWVTTGQDDRSTADALEDPVDAVDALEVSIVDTDAPVGAGEFLRVTAAIENTGTTAVRAEVALVVGHDPERVGRRRLTIEAGETRTVRQGFFTYPVPRESTFPVRVVADGVSAERTVSVRGASTLPVASPDGELAVQPETRVLFEAGAVEPGESQRTVWWVDGERVGTSIGPWQSTYYAAFDADYRWQSFETLGTHEVAAAVVPQEGTRTYAARWRVEVTGGGHASPSVEAVRPRSSVVSVSRGETVTFELEATDPDGSLDRVVWWLTQSDVILGTSDLEGATDTARLSTDAGCHTCRVLPWVIATDGTATALEDAWQFRRREREPSPDAVDVRIGSTNAPVDAGEFLEVSAVVENASGAGRTAELELVVGHDPTVVDTQTVTLDPGETRTVTLGYETYPTSQDERFPVRVIGGGDDDEVTVLVVAR
ncbi:hypothetical protein [Halopiger djelfimassiliensis]|uniref:hypothetical protein n=1 Tax=Halopiger djelfimassiliensis TaxID=1293047 RepID=UPI000677950A|nr:hypothetical protein [Halopiger djelfimassiliensis]